MSTDFRKNDYELKQKAFTIITIIVIGMGIVETLTQFISTNFWNLMSIFTSIGVAVIVVFLDWKRRKREDEHARKTIIENLTEGNNLFEQLTKVARKPESENMEHEILSDIDYYFQENHEKIRDIIRFTKIYVNEWKDLPTTDKEKVEISIKDLSWLLTDYYPIHKPDLIKQGMALENRVTLVNKKREVKKILEQIKNK